MFIEKAPVRKGLNWLPLVNVNVLQNTQPIALHSKNF